MAIASPSSVTNTRMVLIPVSDSPHSNVIAANCCDQTPMIKNGPTAPNNTPHKSLVCQFEVVPRLRSCSHFSDSGTNSRKKNVSSAGNVPSSIMIRQPEYATRYFAHSNEKPVISNQSSMRCSTLVSTSPSTPTSK